MTCARARATLAVLVVGGAASVSQAQAPPPTIEHFQFTPAKVCLRDTMQWGFAYANFPGGLSAVRSNGGFTSAFKLGP